MIAGLILAAGSSRRMGTPKALLPFPVQPLVSVQWLALRSASVDPLRIVVGADAKRVADGSHLARENFVVNKRHADGPFASLQAGIAALMKDDTWPAVVVLPVDAMPPDPMLVLGLAQWLHQENALAAVPTFQDRGGHPVILRRLLCRELLKLNAKKSRLDEVLHALGDDGYCIRVPVPMESIHANLNDPKSYEAALRGAAGPSALKLRKTRRKKT